MGRGELAGQIYHQRVRGACPDTSEHRPHSVGVDDGGDLLGDRVSLHDQHLNLENTNDTHNRDEK